MRLQRLSLELHGLENLEVLRINNNFMGVQYGALSHSFMKGLGPGLQQLDLAATISLRSIPIHSRILRISIASRYIPIILDTLDLQISDH